MTDDIDNDRNFWHDDPTRRLGRLPQRALAQRDLPLRDPSGQRTRQHLPVITTPARATSRPIDPFLVRLGLILCVGLVLVPVAMTLRHGADDILRTAPTGGASAVPVIGGSLASSITSVVPMVDAAAAAQSLPVAQSAP